VEEIEKLRGFTVKTWAKLQESLEVEGHICDIRMGGVLFVKQPRLTGMGSVDPWAGRI
jgi:hypothetical protein